MGYGTSLGTAHEDEISQVMENGLSGKALDDSKEMAANETSGDFQSRFYATDVSTMPLEASRKLTDALKASQGIKTPEKPPETNFVDKLLGTNGTERYQTWPERAVRGAAKAMALPGDVLSGAVEPGSIQEIERATDLAGLLITGPAPVAAKMADGTLGSFMGVKSATMDKKALFDAQEMERNAAHPDDIWLQTGSFRGADGRWRQEIDDSKATLNPKGFDQHTIIDDPRTGGEINKTVSLKDTSQTIPALKGGSVEDLRDWFTERKALADQPITRLHLPDVLDHPELYKAYPELKTIRVEPLPKILEDSQIGHMSSDGPSGTLRLKGDLDPEFAKSVILHEVQHAIQHHEGFAYGGNKDMFLPPELGQATREFESIKAEVEPKIKQEMNIDDKGLRSIKQVVQAEKEGWLKQPEFKEAKIQLERFKQEHPDNYKRVSNIVESERLINNANLEAYEKYMRLMGEVEARQVQARRHMDKFSRAFYSPTRVGGPSGMDRPKSLQIWPPKP